MSYIYIYVKIFEMSNQDIARFEVVDWWLQLGPPEAWQKHTNLERHHWFRTQTTIWVQIARGWIFFHYKNILLVCSACISSFFLWRACLKSCFQLPANNSGPDNLPKRILWSRTRQLGHWPPTFSAQPSYSFDAKARFSENSFTEQCGY